MLRTPKILTGLLVAAFLSVTTVIELGSASGAGPTPSPTSGSTAAAAPGKVTFGVEPASAKGADGRAYFAFGATPTALVTDHVALLNFSYQPLPLVLVATDAINTAQGGITGLQDTAVPIDAGSWINVPKEGAPILVPARTASGPGQVTLPFSVKIPAKAAPGDHTALILAVLSTVSSTSKDFHVRLLQRVGVRVYIRVTGTLRPELAVTNLKATYHDNWNPIGGGFTHLTFNVSNVGNVKLGGLVGISVKGFFGTTSRPAKLINVGLLLPGNSIQLSLDVPGTFPEFRETAMVSVKPLTATGDVDPAVASVSSAQAFWAIPWALIGLIVVVLLVLWLVWRRLRRRRASGGSAALGRHTTPNANGGQAPERQPAVGGQRVHRTARSSRRTRPGPAIEGSSK